MVGVEGEVVEALFDIEERQGDLLAFGVGVVEQGFGEDFLFFAEECGGEVGLGPDGVDVDGSEVERFGRYVVPLQGLR